MNISDIVSKSLKLAWQHKMLWIFALLLGGGMGSGNGNFERLGDTFSKDRNQQEQNITTPKTVTTPKNYQYYNEEIDPKSLSIPDRVLGTATGNPSEDFDNKVAKQVLESSAPQVALVVISFAVFMVFVIVLSLIQKSWAWGAFLTGIDAAINETPYDLRKLGTNGRVTMRENLKLGVFLFFLTLMFFVIVFTPGVFFLASGSDALGGLFVFFAVVFLIIYVVMLTYGSKFAYRYTSVDRFGYLNAIKQGILVFKRNFGKALLLSFTNCIITMVFGMGMLFVLGLLAVGVIGATSVAQSESLRTVLILLAAVVGVPLFVAFMVGMAALSGYLATYTNFTWSFFFNYATRKNMHSADTVPVVGGTNV